MPGEDTIRLLVDMGASPENIEKVKVQLDELDHSAQHVSRSTASSRRRASSWKKRDGATE